MLGLFDRFNDLAESSFFSQPVRANLKAARPG